MHEEPQPAAIWRREVRKENATKISIRTSYIRSIQNLETENLNFVQNVLNPKKMVPRITPVVKEKRARDTAKSKQDNEEEYRIPVEMKIFVQVQDFQIHEDKNVKPAPSVDSTVKQNQTRRFA